MFQLPSVRCEFVEPKDQEWGAPGKNGLWTGVIGMVLSGVSM